MWFPFALSTALLWGVGQILAKKGFQHVSPLWSNIITAAIGFCIFIPLALLQGVEFAKIAGSVPLVLLVSASYQTYLYALEKGQVALSGTVIAVYPLITILLARLFLNETTSIYQKIAIVFVFVGIIIISLPKNILQQKQRIFEPWLLWSLTAAVVIGTGDFIAKVAIDRTGINTYLFTQAFTSMFIVALLFTIDKQGRKHFSLTKSTFTPAILGYLFLELGILTFNYAFSFGTATLVTTVASAYVAISLILALVVLKEKLTKQQLGGALSVIFGIILLGLG